MASTNWENPHNDEDPAYGCIIAFIIVAVIYSIIAYYGFRTV